MKMEDKCVLRDCLESEKHLAEMYESAAFESDSDNIRETFLDVMHDKCELQAATFNLMHQMGIYKTAPAADQQLQKARQKFSQSMQQIRSGSQSAHPVH